MRRVVVAAVGVLLVAGLAVGLVFAFRSPGRGPTGARYSQPVARLSIPVPTGWHVTTKNWTAVPEERFVLYSGKLPEVLARRTDGTARGPVRPGQVAAALVENYPLDYLGYWPPRPAHFQLTQFGPTGGAFEKGNWYALLFRDHGRAFTLHIGIGEGGAALLPTLFDALDTLRVGRDSAGPTGAVGP